MTDTAVTRAVRFRRGITLPILLLIVWEVSSRTGFADPRFLPSLEDMALTAKRELFDNNLIGELGSSLAQPCRLSHWLHHGRRLRPHVGVIAAPPIGWSRGPSTA